MSHSSYIEIWGNSILHLGSYKSYFFVQRKGAIEKGPPGIKYYNELLQVNNEHTAGISFYSP